MRPENLAQEMLLIAATAREKIKADHRNEYINGKHLESALVLIQQSAMQGEIGCQIPSPAELKTRQMLIEDLIEKGFAAKENFDTITVYWGRVNDTCNT